MDSEDNPVDDSMSLGQEDQMNDLRQALEEAEVRLQKAEARNNHLLETLIATSQLQQALGFEDAKKVLQEIMVNFVEPPTLQSQWFLRKAINCCQ